MKNNSRFLLLAITAILIAFATLAALVVYYRVNSLPLQINELIVSVIISFFSSAIILLAVQFFILRKLNNLIRTVQNYRSANDKPLIKSIQSKNEIEHLTNEIEGWAKDRKEELERLKKHEIYRKEFLGNVSHELKTPIFNIQGYVATLLDGGLEDETINRNYLVRAEKSIDRMITIIYDLEAISQLETGELQLEQERFDITLLLQDVLEAQEMKATARGIILTLLTDGKPVFVMADRFRIRQVIVNLITNSVKYGKEYGETKIKIYDIGDNISIEISDNGIGIAKEHLPRLFERFYRVDKSRSREQGGTGLGLAIVKHIIEAHNQTISVISTEGVGTSFSFTLKKA